MKITHYTACMWLLRPRLSLALRKDFLIPLMKKHTRCVNDNGASLTLNWVIEIYPWNLDTLNNPLQVKRQSDEKLGSSL